MPEPTSEGLKMRFCGWCLLLIGMTGLGWMVGMDTTTEVSRPFQVAPGITTPHTERLIDPRLVQLQLVGAIAFAAFLVLGGIFIAAGHMVRALATSRALGQTAPAAAPIQPPQRAPANDGARDAALRATQSDDGALVFGFALAGVAVLIFGAVAFLA
jgi:hypothetical protein